MGKTLRVKLLTSDQQKKKLKAIYKRANSMALTNKKRLYKKFLCVDDWLLQHTHLQIVLGELDWTPDMDAACDIKGSNKHFANYCSIKRDALLEDLTQCNVYCNPPYLCCGEFINKFEETKQERNGFRAVIILPLRKST